MAMIKTETLKAIKVIKKVATMKNCPLHYRLAARLFKLMGY